jgi:hypothetical protein
MKSLKKASGETKKCPFWKECLGGEFCKDRADKEDKDLYETKPFCFIDNSEELY